MRFTLLLFLAFSLTNAQDFSESEVFFSNGKSMKGYGKIGLNRFVFKKEKEGRTIAYKHIGIDSVQVKNEAGITKFQFKENGNSIILMNVIVSGEATLLSRSYNIKLYNNSSTISNVPTSGTPIYQHEATSYFISKKGSLEAKRIFTEGAAFDNNFRRTMSKIFKSCPSLIEKLENKEYRKKDIREVVRYFNKNCSF